MLTLTETQQLPMYEFCYPNTKIDEFDRTSGTFNENEILTATKNQNEGIVKFDFDDASSEIFRIENINNKIDQAAEALLSLAERTQHATSRTHAGHHHTYTHQLETSTAEWTWAGHNT